MTHTWTTNGFDTVNGKRRVRCDKTDIGQITEIQQQGIL